MLRIINLSKSYNNQLILGDINLAVKNGEVVTIDGGEWIAGAGEFSDLTKLPESMWKAMAESRKKK